MSRRVNLQRGQAFGLDIMVDDPRGDFVLVSAEEINAALGQALSLGIGITILEELGIEVDNHGWKIASSGSA